MTTSHETRFTTTQLLWVGVIAFIAAVLTGWYRTESVPATLLMGVLSSALSVAIVWFIAWMRSR